MPGCFDFALLDGNHDERYLSREITAIDRVLKPGGFFVFDDVDWTSVGEVYQTLDAQYYERVATDGRVGLAMKKVDPAWGRLEGQRSAKGLESPL